MVYTHLAAGILGAAVAFGAAWKVQDWRYGEQIATMQKEAAQATANAIKDAMVKTQEDQRRKDDALKEANLRSQENALAAAAANRTADSLRDQLATARANLPKASREAIIEYANACQSVLGDLEETGREISSKADGHANDAEKLNKAWPNP